MPNPCTNALRWRHARLSPAEARESLLPRAARLKPAERAQLSSEIRTSVRTYSISTSRLAPRRGPARLRPADPFQQRLSGAHECRCIRPLRRYADEKTKRTKNTARAALDWQLQVWPRNQRNLQKEPHERACESGLSSLYTLRRLGTPRNRTVGTGASQERRPRPRPIPRS